MTNPFSTGDGAGVGKGRTIAGLIFENYLLGRKRAVWYVLKSIRYDFDFLSMGFNYLHKA